MDLPRSSLLIAILILFSGCAGTRMMERSPSKAHREKALRHLAEMQRPIFHLATAKLALGVDTAYAWHVVDTLLAHPSGDMFWLYPAAGFYFHCREKLDERWRQRFRDALKQYTPYRGDTENHFLMYYGSLLLFSQEWPDLPGSEWFNGKSSRENYDEAKEYLEQWLDETARHGITEWDSPQYHYFYITPLLILRDFTADRTLRARCDLMLEYLLADFAAEYLAGSYCGAHSRDGDNTVKDPRTANTASYGQFFFEDSLGLILPDLSYAALSGFECPPIIRGIAHDRATPFLHQEMKRSRARIRFAGTRHTPAYKYTWMTPSYALGSIQGGVFQPIQQHSWDITFASSRTHNTIFGLHPYASGTELGTFFPEEPELMVASVAATKGSYVSEDKWIGSSPYERIVQHEGTLAAIYDIHPSAPFQHVDLFLPRTLDTVERDPSGWVFARMEDVLVAIYPLQRAYQWIEEPVNWRMRIPADEQGFDGYIIDCRTSGAMSYEEFKERYRRSPVQITRGISAGSIRTITFTRANGDTMKIETTPDVAWIYVNGRQITRDPTHLFNGPHLRSVAGSGIVEMTCNGMRRILDFTQNRAVEID